jgi:hypothetical protein
MDFDKLLHDLADDRGWNLLYVEKEDIYRLQLSLPEGRFQDVYVNFRRDEESSYVATMWSVISDVTDFNFEDPKELLRFNWRNIYGCLAIRGEEVILLQNQLTDDANWGEVGKAIHYIGLNADSMEKAVYGADHDEN